MKYIIKALVIVMLSGSMLLAKNGTLFQADLQIILGQTQAEASRSWTDAQLLLIINMAAHQIAPMGGGLQRFDTIQGGNLHNVYPADFIALRGTSWLWRAGKPFVTIPFKPVDSFHVLIATNDAQVQGRNNHILTEDGGSIAVYPNLPVTDSLLISYFAHADIISGGVEIEFDDAWEQVLLYASAAIAYQKLDDRFWVQFYIAERDKLIAILSALTSRRPAPSDVR